jgi:hypothetical protein
VLRHLAALSPFVALAIACASPTLPLPPPLAPSISAGPDADHVKLTAACNPSERNVVIVVINENVNVPRAQAVGGALADPGCGQWDTIMYGHSGDPLVVTYQLNGQISQPQLVHIP